MSTCSRSTLSEKQKVEDSPVYKRYYADTSEQRREKLMPFFWRELMVKHGSIAGNLRLNSAVTLTEYPSLFALPRDTRRFSPVKRTTT